MNTILHELPGKKLMKSTIRENWKAYHYSVGRSPNVELSRGRYLNWLMTDLPDYFMNLVVSNHLPSDVADDLIENTLHHFKLINIKKLSWLAEEELETGEIKKSLLAHGLTFRESFSTEMAIDLASLKVDLPTTPGLEIVPVVNTSALRQWIHIASIGFRISQDFEDVWCRFFADVIFDTRFRTYLALLHGKPVGTSQLFLSKGVAGIYNVSCIPDARGQGIGSAITLAPLLEARELGYRIGILQASKRGYSVYRRLGFQDYGNLSVYLWENDK
jgi:GNAT superfamily N-acetyltransferase